MVLKLKQTILNVLNCSNQWDLRPKKRENLFLQPTHRSERLKWANNHKNWTRNNLRRIISSDKTKISIWGSDGIK
jgi:ADP-glucose pyrophosphorylase